MWPTLRLMSGQLGQLSRESKEAKKVEGRETIEILLC